MSIRSALIVAVAGLGLGSPAFAASYGGLSNDSGSMLPSYYDNNGWHQGLAPEARAALTAQQQHGRGLQLFAGRSRELSGSAHPVARVNGGSGAGAMSDQLLQNDWFWGGLRN